MRKLSFLMVLLFCVTAIYAQKGKVIQATSYFTSGKLDQAKKLIDEAMQHEACANYDKGYFTKGQIYQALYESPIPDYRKLAPGNALDIALEAYNKVIELDVKKKYTDKLEQQYKNLIIDYTNKAIEYYNADNFAEAFNTFEKVLELEHSPIVTKENAAVIDTAVIFNAAIAAQRSNNFVKAEEYYKKALTYNYNLSQTYPFLAAALKAQNKEEEALKVLQKGYELFPNNSAMLVELINHYLNTDAEKAFVFLDKAIEQDPTNASYYRAKGLLYEKLQQMEKAGEMYQKTLEYDPKDFMAQYGLGNVKLSEVIKLDQEVSNIVDINEYNKGIEKVYAGYASVIPYFEKALELEPTEQKTMATLKQLYFRLINTDPKYQQKYDEIQAKLNAQ